MVRVSLMVRLVTFNGVAGRSSTTRRASLKVSVSILVATPAVELISVRSKTATVFPKLAASGKFYLQFRAFCFLVGSGVSRGLYS